MGMRADRPASRHRDHGAMCWDEVVAFPRDARADSGRAGWQVAAFLLFRFFDVVKPSPIREVERRLKGGFGVMADDILAAGLRAGRSRAR
jgi:phosphatidylglycerophosphatase A